MNLPENLANNRLLDDTGQQILRHLQAEARLSFVELGQRVGLSPPAVAERVRRMEEAGIITGYRAEVSAARVGLPVAAFIRLQTGRGNYPALLAEARSNAAVLECHHLAGQDAFLLRVAAPSVAVLEEIIERLSHYGETQTAVVLSSPVSGKPLVAAPPQE
ncbi:MAG: Lrp/AsnC family transcriptional regulator [Anaerolineae bacterium]